MVKKMVFSDHINFYSLAKLSVVKEMVFANHINCYGLAGLFIVTGKWSCQTIVLVIVPPDYICDSRNGFCKPHKLLWSGKTIYCDWKMVLLDHNPN
jgi:hypothetical protein